MKINGIKAGDIVDELKWISEQLCYIMPESETDRPVLAALIGQRSTLVIDAGNSTSHAKHFLALLESEKIDADWLAVTHFHWDHTFGMAAFRARVVTQEGTKQKLDDMRRLSWTDEAIARRVEIGEESAFCVDHIKKEFRSGDREIKFPFPDITYTEGLVIDLGGITCHLQHVGGDHTPDSSVIYVPELRFLHAGDALYPNIMDWSHTADKTLALVLKLEKLDVETCILSHHDTPLGREEFKNELQLLKDLSLLTVECHGDRDLMASELERQLGRGLTEDDLERVGYFCNGYALTTD